MERRVALVAYALVLGACTYDFDAAFSSASGGAGGTSAGTASGVGGTSAGTGSGAGTGTGTGSGTGTGTGSPGSEDCFNGIDDDSDDLVDCEDEDCLDGTCQPLPPPGWEPAALALRTRSDTLPDCAAPWPTSEDGNGSLDAPPASCDACSCGAPSFSCSPPTITTYTSPNCGAGSDEEVTMASTCSTVMPNDFDAFVATPPQVMGSCPAAGGQATVPSATWQQQGRICTGAALGSGCGDDVCAPMDSDFAVCVTREGDETCPAGYPDKTVLYDDFTDSRDCTACSCTPDVQCDDDIEVHMATSFCFGQADFIEPADGTCKQVGRGSITVSFEWSPQATTNPCIVGGGQPTGQATPNGARTVCCTRAPMVP